MRESERTAATEHIAKLALAGRQGGYDRTAEEIHDHARDLLDTGNPREEHRADLLRAAQTVRRRAPAEDTEDPTLTAMDGLVGRCSPGARL